MPIIPQIIARLRSHENRFGERVAGLAELSALRTETNLATPCAFVLPDGEAAANENKQGGWVRSFDIRVNVAIVVWLDANGDPRNQRPTHELDEIRDELIEALCFWRPDESYDGFSYRGYQPAGQDAGRATYLFNFSTEQRLTRVCRTPETRAYMEELISNALGVFREAPSVMDPQACGVLKHTKGVRVVVIPQSCDPATPPEQAVIVPLKEMADGRNDAC